MTTASQSKRDFINEKLFYYATKLLEENGLASNQVKWLPLINPSEQAALRIGYQLKSIDMFIDMFEAESKIEPKLQKYYVTYEPLKCYTSIGAENVYHAYNKATKEFKGKWSRIVRHTNGQFVAGWEFLSVADFNALLKSIKI